MVTIPRVINACLAVPTTSRIVIFECKSFNGVPVRSVFKTLADRSMADESISEWGKSMNYPLVIQYGLNDDLQTETLDLVVSVVVRTQGNFEACVKALKEDMDKRQTLGGMLLREKDFPTV
jgi:hypothetical protein